MDPLSLVCEKALDFGLKLAGKELGYLLCYKSKVNELKGKTTDLKNKQRTLQERINHEAKTIGKVTIHKDVEDWLQKVDEKEAEIQNEEGSSRTKWSNYDGLIPYLFVRHQRGRRTVKLAEDVDMLLKDGNFGEVASRSTTPTWAESAFIESGYESLDSRIKIMENVINTLKDPSVKTVGIWGQGGVGKTTIIKAVAKKAQEMKLFKVVVMATITRNPQIKNIQGLIADMLGMTLGEETEIGRAGQIRERLKKEENTLVILDDLWDRLDLNKLGIPIHDDDSNQKPMEKEKSGDSYGGCKILLTSRSKNVLSTQMDVEENSIFSMEELEEKEAKILFKKVAGWDNKTSEFDFESLASKIVKKCKGLPMVLVIVGRALKDKSYSVCEDTLLQLEKQQFTRLQEPMEFSTKLSYDHLGNEELKATFLLCAQMGNDSLIVDLLKYCIGLGILEGVYTIREARGKLTRLIETLKDSSLLLKSYSSDRFTMHDTIRDAALSIAFKEQHAFIKRNVKLHDWLDEDKLEKYTIISLHHCDIVHELPKSINCPRLKVFQVESKDYSLRIPDAFFERMTKLQVLVLTGIDLSCMPSSIKYLQNLIMLCLEQCVIGDNLSLIGELKKLRILVFQDLY